ncbi:Hsp70 family protein [Aspergillus melleus]|uniref:Hsp70 family protein n=1 Tax=Aspergillus melleus TaxID=138277 RepID=UPI001E8D46D6|nr:uncharacterized protein LDX57_009318 [Aspergillus melleus]KAH8431663.1 hypothetical protein LDX57_009318 [Aspergillus melleus]
MASPSPPRLIIGLDYGTTFSGISVSRPWADPSAVQLIQKWPSDYLRYRHSCKTPSRIAFPEDNPELAQNDLRWGYQVAPTMIAASWTKLLLADTGPPIGDKDLKWAISLGLSHLPRGRSWAQVITAYLHMLYRHLRAFLRDKMAIDSEGWGRCLDSIQMEVWLTVPAAWSEISRADVRHAALEAGFGSRTADQLCLLTEPEAALMATLHGRLENGSAVTIEPGECVVICDCGGGSVDIASYFITSRDPLQYHELVPSTGEFIGSTSIDRAFCRFLSEQWGDSFMQAPRHLVAPGSFLMKWFEGLKYGYSGTPGDYVHRQRLLGLDIALSRKDLYSMFEPVVSRVCELLITHLEEARNAINQPGIRAKVFLVGGFSESRYLRQEVTEMLDRKRHITVNTLKDPLASSNRSWGWPLGPPRFTPGHEKNTVKLGR